MAERALRSYDYKPKATSPRICLHCGAGMTAADGCPTCIERARRRRISEWIIQPAARTGKRNDLAGKAVGVDG